MNVELSLKLLFLRGDDPTVWIVNGCENAMLIFRLMDLYWVTAAGVCETTKRLKLADAKLFDLSVFARTCESWHVGIEQLAVLALDMKLKERATVFNDRQAR